MTNSVRQGGRTYRMYSLRNGMVPVCVLGPMADQQRAALKDALALYGHGKSDAEAWGE
ncbi:hypothetical protein ACFWFF_34860 [Streptomyces sp. NPDC060223]|uniref:hypothetical protein n=1 Tax=unclassified Streptomyces TaxID=2593676 RepID=UPI0036383711